MKRKLNDSKIAGLKTPEKKEKHFDGGGMYLEMMPSGTRTWRYKFYFLGIEKNITLGYLPEMNLDAAREQHMEYRKQVKAGFNPLVLKQIKQSNKAHQNNNTFEKVARDWMDYCRNLRTLKPWDESYHKTVKQRLERNLFPKIGMMPIGMINSSILWEHLKVIKSNGKHETAKRVNNYCSLIYDYASSLDITQIRLYFNL